MKELIEKLKKVIEQHEQGLTLDYEACYQMIDLILRYLKSIGKA